MLLYEKGGNILIGLEIMQKNTHNSEHFLITFIRTLVVAKKSVTDIIMERETLAKFNIG